MKPSRLVTSGGVRRHTGRGMKKITKAALVGGAAAAAIAATVGIAPTASATPVENTWYLQSLVNKGWEIWDVNLLLQQGNQVCNDIDNIPGWTGADARNWLISYNGYSYQGAYEVVDAATYNICPEFLPGGWANPRGSLGL